MGWFRVASHLCLTIGELKARVTPTEYLQWLEYLRWDERRQSKQDFAIARLTAEVIRNRVKHPRQIKERDCLVVIIDQQTNEDRLARSKYAWLTAVGFKPEKKVEEN